MIGRKKMTSSQICDGKGPKTEIAALYNAAPSAHFVLDRQGRIAGLWKGAEGVEKMREVVAKLMQQ